MTSVTAYTAARMKQIEDNSIVDGEVVSGNLILSKFNGQTVNAGSVIGPQGPAGTMPSVARWIAHPTVGQIITFNQNTMLNFGGELQDTNAFHSTTVNTSRATIPSGMGGMYLVGYSIGANPGPPRYILSAWINVNGLLNTTRYAYQQTSFNADFGNLLTGSAILLLSPGDFVEIAVFQNAYNDTTQTPMNINFNANNTSYQFWGTRLGPA